MKKLCALLIAASLLSVLTPVFAADSLVSRSYIEETYIPGFTEKARLLISASLQPVYGRLGGMLARTVGECNGTVFVKTGGSFVLTTGQANIGVCFGAIVDASTGAELRSVSEAVPGRLYIVAENSLAMLTPAEGCVLALDGLYAKPDFSSATFSDVETEHWAFEYVETMAALSLVNGRGGGLFDPGANMTRGEFVTVLGRLFGVDAKNAADSEFLDVDNSAFYAPYINWAASEGLIGGYGDGTVGPNDKITRAQMAVLIVRFAEKLGIVFNPPGDDTAQFSDHSELPGWAEAQIYAARSAGLIQGRENGNFDPGNFALRCEVCAILYRLLDRPAPESNGG